MSLITTIAKMAVRVMVESVVKCALVQTATLAKIVKKVSICKRYMHRIMHTWSTFADIMH